MRPSTPHYTSPADLRERLNQPRIQTGIAEHGGAIRGLIVAVCLEAVLAIFIFGTIYVLRSASH
jgi:hypothetical protein